MAGGQERVLRRRIRSVQSTRKITKAMELIAASRIVRAQNRIAANRPYREGMARILRLDGGGRPDRAAKKLLGTPESPQHVGILAIVGDRGLAGLLQLRRAARRPSALVARAPGRRGRGPVWSGGQEGAVATSASAASTIGAVLRRHSPTGRSSPTPGHIAAMVVGAVPGRRDRPGAAGLHPVHLGRHPARRALQLLPLPLPEVEARASSPSDEARVDGYTEFEPEPEKLLGRAGARGPSRPRSSPPCSKGRPRSSRPSSGPWRRPPTTRTSWSAP